MNTNQLTARKTDGGLELQSITIAGAKTVYLEMSINCLYEPSPSMREAITKLHAISLKNGTAGHDRKTWSRLVGETGSEISINIAEGICTISLITTGANLAQVWPLFKEMLTEPLFDTKELKRSQKILQQKCEVAKEDARQQSINLLHQELYLPEDVRHHPSPSDLILALRKVNATKLKRYHDEWLKTAWRVTVGGNSKTVKEVFALIADLRQNLPFSSDSLDRQPLFLTELNNPKRIVTLDIPSKQNLEINLGVRTAVTMQAPEFPAWLFSIAVLGRWGGFTGRLMRTVRERDGLTYGIYAKNECLNANFSGHSRIETFFSPKDVKRGLKNTINEITRLRKQGVEKDELEHFKTIFATDFRMINDSLGRRVSHNHKRMLRGLDEEEFRDIQEKIQNLTISEVNSVIKDNLNFATATISCVGPVNSEVRKILETV